MKTLLTSALTVCLLLAVGCAEGNAPDHKTGTVIVAYEEGVTAESKENEVKAVIAGLSDGKYTLGE